MFLLFDAGNTRLKWALASSDLLITKSGAIDYESIDELLHGMSCDVGEILVSSVAGADRERLIIGACETQFSTSPIFASVSISACGVENRYQTLNTLGVDRWVAALGAHRRTGNRIIVDAGTAVTIDLLNDENQYLGGVIIPGSRLMHSALIGETAGIAAKRDVVDSVVGVTTQQCVNAGIQYGLIGAVDSIIDEMLHAVCLNGDWRVLVCGGDGGWLIDLLKTKLPAELDNNLIFKGLLHMKSTGAL